MTTTVTAIICPRCNDTIYSRSHHDFRSCECGACYVDGGREYFRMGWDEKVGKPNPFEMKVEATNQELFEDWDRRQDKFGKITKEKEKL